MIEGKRRLSKGIELTEGLIRRLHKYHVTTVYIEDEDSEGIELIKSFLSIRYWKQKLL